MWLIHRSSESVLKTENIILFLPIIAIWAISRIFSVKLILDEDNLSVKKMFFKKKLPYTEISDIKYKPGGFFNGITIDPRIVIIGYQIKITIPLNKDNEEIENSIAEILNQTGAVDLLKEKEKAILESKLVFFPTEAIGESILYLILLIASIIIGMHLLA
jgi:hypothetical protein